MVVWMIKLRRWYLYIFAFVYLFVCVYGGDVKAKDFGQVSTNGIYEIPDSFRIAVHDRCSGHDFFQQVSARSDGSFLVLYRQANRPVSGTIFGTAYIDVYDEDGIFLYELTFDTPNDCAVEYIQDGIVLYFYDHIIVYDPKTDVCEGYSTTAEAALQSGVYKKLRDKKFTCGQWQYTCTETFFNRTGLIRTNGTVTQELLSLPGTGLTVWNTVFAAILFVIIHVFLGTLLLYCIKRKKRRTGDG